MTQKIVYFAGATGPEASGGAMAIAYVLSDGASPLTKGVLFMVQGFDGSWHSATYHALAFAVEQCRGRLGACPVFLTDDDMVVKQMVGTMGVKGGHYVEAREDAIEALVHRFPLRGDTPEFRWVPQHENLAVPYCLELLEEHGIIPWTYRKATNVGDTIISRILQLVKVR